MTLFEQAFSKDEELANLMRRLAEADSSLMDMRQKLNIANRYVKEWIKAVALSVPL